MSVSADMYLVISLMFAVFAAVAAVGTSIVLGAGFERLRAGFEVIKRQTGFFADAIHKLDQRTQSLEKGHARLKKGHTQLNKAFSCMSDRVDRVEKQTSFVADSIHTLEKQVHSATYRPHKMALQKDVDLPVKPGKPSQEAASDVANDTANDTSETDMQGLLEKIRYVGSGLESEEAKKPSAEPGEVLQKSMKISALLRSYVSGGRHADQAGVTFH